MESNRTLVLAEAVFCHQRVQARTASEPKQLGEIFGTAASPAVALAFEAASHVHLEALFNGSAAPPWRSVNSPKLTTDQRRILRLLAGSEPANFIRRFAR
jgi:hypothetical protein